MLQKSIFSFLLLGFFAGLAQAQPVISTSVLPNIGDVVTLTVADTINVNPGNAGANQTWNFANLQPLSGTQPTTNQYIAPAGTPYFGNFPSATIVTKVLQDTVVYAYFREEPNQFLYLGAGSIVYDQLFSNPDAQLKYPTNFNATYQDDFAYSTDAGNAFVFYSEGSRTVKYDAYGTLTTPLGTFQNAMRIKATSSQIDSTGLPGFEIINQTNLTTYAWLVAGHPGTMASVYYTQTITETRIVGFDTTIITSPVTKAVNYVSASSVGAFELAPSLEGITDLNLGPNPATDQLNLRFKANNGEQDLKLLITDASGRVLQTQAFASVLGENTLPLSVGQLPSGAYFLTLTNGHGAQTVGWQKL